MTFRERKETRKAAYEWMVWREVEYDDGTIEIYENTIPADTIEEAVKEAAERNEQNMILRHVDRAQTIKAEMIKKEGVSG